MVPVLVLLVGLMAQALPAAEVRLLHANPAVVRSRSLAVAPGSAAPGLELRLEASGRVHLMQLRPHSRLGVLESRLSGKAQAYEGSVGGYVGSWAAITRIGNRWTGIWYDGGEYFGVDSAGALAGSSDTAATLAPDVPVVYRLRDVMWEELLLDDDALPGETDGERLVAHLAAPVLEPATRRLRIALVADSQLVAQEGDATEANLLARLNMIDGLFANQLGVRISADSVSMFQQADPFSRTSSAETLLKEIAEWRAATATQQAAGLTLVFTARALQGRTVGMAYMDSLCSKRYSAAMAQASTAVGFSALIAAHEVAHVFGAPHDGDAAGACPTTPTDYLMSPRINGSQDFSQCSVEQMAPRAKAAACLDSMPKATAAPVAEPPQPQSGGGGMPDRAWLGLLLALAAVSVRRRASQILANHCAR